MFGFRHPTIQIEPALLRSVENLDAIVRIGLARRSDNKISANDAEALGRALADELTYAHSTGVLQTKPEFISELAAGSMQYRQITVLEQHFRMHGFIGIINGVARMAVRRAGTDQQFSVRYTDIYVRRSGRWQLLAWQSTRLPD